MDLTLLLCPTGQPQGCRGYCLLLQTVRRHMRQLKLKLATVSAACVGRDHVHNTALLSAHPRDADSRTKHIRRRQPNGGTREHGEGGARGHTFYASGPCHCVDAIKGDCHR
jgi:hypothetical protein